MFYYYSYSNYNPLRIVSHETFPCSIHVAFFYQPGMQPPPASLVSRTASWIPEQSGQLLLAIYYI